MLQEYQSYNPSAKQQYFRNAVFYFKVELLFYAKTYILSLCLVITVAI